MNNFKNIIAIVALCAIGSIAAKVTTRTSRTSVIPSMDVPSSIQQTPIVPVFKPLPSIPASMKKPLPTIPTSVENAANAEMEAELAKIEKSQNAIKNSAFRILKDQNIDFARKSQFIKRVQITYDVIIESCQEDWNAMVSTLQNVIFQGQEASDIMSEDEIRMRRE